MVVLDTAIANVSLRYIAGSLAAGVDESTWVVSTYLIANAVVLPASGWLSNVLGRKRFYMICVAVFTVSSLLCGLATSLGALIFFRILQGLGGGGMPTSEQAILADTFPPQTARPGLRALRRRRHRCADRRADAGRLDHRQLLLALDLLHQCSHRHHLAWPCAMAGRRARSARTRAPRAPGRRAEGRLGRLPLIATSLGCPRGRSRSRRDRRLVQIDQHTDLCGHLSVFAAAVHSLGNLSGRSDRRNSSPSEPPVFHVACFDAPDRRHPVRLQSDHATVVADDVSLHGDAFRPRHDAGRLCHAADHAAGRPGQRSRAARNTSSPSGFSASCCRCGIRRC